MDFDATKYEQSRRTLREFPPIQRRLYAGGPAVHVQKRTVDVPGYFVDGRLISYEVRTMPRMGRFGMETQVLGHGETEEDAIQMACREYPKYERYLPKE